MDIKVWRGMQSLNGQLIDADHAPKLRATVHRDGYDPQSYGLIEAWTPERGWAEIERRPIQLMRSHGLSYAMRDDKWETQGQEAVRADLNDLWSFGFAFFAGVDPSPPCTPHTVAGRPVRG